MSNKFLDFINLHSGEEKRDKVVENIKANISFRGSNLWILACAIVIASIGLNVNSTAVIIGAMLISPLMGPIVGAGFALAVYDLALLKRAGKNLLIASVVSLIVATLYFYVSPFKETQSEILARTSPNIYDVLIAFFGGLVGAIAITRVEKGNPIPGVAIATALMPPLCTAGFGLATANFTFFLGAIYLYSINCFFICFSTYLIIKYLKYEPLKNPDVKIQKRIQYGISGLMLILVLPSFYLAYNLWEENQFRRKADQFITNELSNNNYTIIFKRLETNTHPRKIELAFLNKKFTDEEISSLSKKLVLYDMPDTKLEIKQDTKDLKSEILHELSNQNLKLSEKDILINNLQKELSEYKFNNPEIFAKVEILFPELQLLSVGKHLTYPNTDSAKVNIVMLYKKINRKAKIDEEKIVRWLKQELHSDDIILVENSGYRH